MENKSKEFALEQIAPYFKDPSICGRNLDGTCMNITPDGKMCVAGKNYLPEVREEFTGNTVVTIMGCYEKDQSKVFIPSSVGILTWEQWACLQNIHDGIASFKRHLVKVYVERLGLFTYKELEEYASKL